MSWIIYHSPRCSKSREAFKIMQDEGLDLEVVEYLKTPPTQTQLKTLIKNSKLDPSKFVRKREKEFAEYSDNDLKSLDKVVKMIHKYPKLLERPIVAKGAKVIIARPPDLIYDLI